MLYLCNIQSDHVGEPLGPTWSSFLREIECLHFKSFGTQTVESNQIIKETAKRMGFSEGTIKGMLIGLAEVVNRHLREGDRVRLQDWGMMKLEIESDKVDDPKTFRAKKHIRGVRLHFLPESYEGTQALYEGITFEKEKG